MTGTLTNGALVDEVRTRLAHALATGTPLPSRRALARELGVTEHAARRALGEATGHPDLTQPVTQPPTQSPSSSPTPPKASPNPAQHGTLGDPDHPPTHPLRPLRPDVAHPILVGDTQRPAGEPAHAPTPPTRGRTIARWPLLLLAAPAFVAIWGGWVGLGELVGFGVVKLLPGIWDTLTLNTAVTLPIGLETYAAYALHVALSGRAPTQSARRFAQWSAVGALVLGAGGQVAYHLMTAAGLTRAPWGITAAVAVLPVLVLGLGAALAHLTHPQDTQ